VRVAQGLAFDCQLLPPGSIPMAAHDVRMDLLATPAGLVDCRAPATSTAMR
jgi:5-formyltetrahydrofolate cyclo-ligase